MDIIFSLDAIAARPITISFEREGVHHHLSFSPIVISDIADYSAEIRSAKLKNLRENFDVVKDEHAKIRAIDALALATIDDAMLLMTDIFGRAWAVDRCYRKANPKETRNITSFLSVAEINYCFERIAQLSGIINPVKKAESPEKEI